MREHLELKQSLYAGTFLIIQAAEGIFAISDFVEKYDNFYYFEALNGHEEDEHGRFLLCQYSEVIAAHEKVQTTIVDLLFLGPDEEREQYLKAGRIGPKQAKERLNEIVVTYHLHNHLASLS